MSAGAQSQDKMQVITSKKYKPGEIIYSEKPFVRVLSHTLWNEVCAGCLKRKRSLKKCAGCGIMKFCGEECKKKAWPDHKLECPYLPKYKDFAQQNLVHMMGNVILKLKGKDWKTVTAKILNVEVNFDELVSDAGDARGRCQILEAQAIEGPLKSYIGEENMPNQATLKKLLGKVTENQFGFKLEDSPSMGSVGWALFLGASKLDHSCVPNAIWDVSASSITIRAIKPIEEGEQVTIYYRSVLDESSPLIFLSLQKSWNNCYCSDCSQPFGTSDLTKVLDISKASAIIEISEHTLLLISLLAQFNLPVENIVRNSRLERILSAHEGVLGRTNRAHLQMLAALHYRSGPAALRRRGLRELEIAIKLVWGEYYPELYRVYRKLVFCNLELGNQQEARNYVRKMLQLEVITEGKTFDESDETVNKEMSNIFEEFRLGQLQSVLMPIFGRLF